MKRLELFRARTETHLLYRRLACRLSEQEKKLCEEFILENDSLPKEEFETKIRLLVARPTPIQNTEHVEALLLMSNCALNYERPKEGHTI